MNKWNKKFTNGNLEIVLESNQSTKIIRNKNGYYLICEEYNSSSPEYMNVGFFYDEQSVAIENANKKLRELKYKEKNLAISLVYNFLKKIEKSQKDFDKSIISILNAALSLPSASIPKYIANTITYNIMEKSAAITDDSLMNDFYNLYSKIINIDPSTQDVISNFTSLNSDRKTTIERLIGIKAVNEKNKLVFKKYGSEKVFEAYSGTYDNSILSAKDIFCNGITISLQDDGLDCTIDLIFVNGRPYIILNDRINNFHDIVDSGKNTLKNLFEDYNVNLLNCINDKFLKTKIFEAFGDEEVGSDSPFSSSLDDTGDDISLDDTSGEGDTSDDEEVDDIIDDIDPEIEKEVGIIESNIEKIENLPDDIRENESIQEIFLLLLGKKEKIQRDHDEKKSSEIIDNIVNDIKTELGEVDNIFKQDNSDDNEIKVEEGKTIEINGVLIKPMISSEFGKKEKFLVVESKSIKAKHIITGSRSIKAVLESYEIGCDMEKEIYYIDGRFNDVGEAIDLIMVDENSDEIIKEIMELSKNYVIQSSFEDCKTKVTVEEIVDYLEFEV